MRTTRWIDVIIENLRPKFGGIPTFVEDPDHLLDIPDVREALRAGGVSLGDWDGTPASLAPFKTLRDTEMPILVVGESATRYTLDVCLTDFRWVITGVSGLMPKFAPAIVKSIPYKFWDQLLALHDQTLLPRAPHETALLIGRALYGVDTEFLRHGAGWLSLLSRLAVAEDPLPLPVARAVIESMSPPWPALTQAETLSDTSSIRAALSSIMDGQPLLYEQASRAEQILLGDLRVTYTPITPSPPVTNLLNLWESCCHKPEDVLAFGLQYTKAHSAGAGAAPEALRIEIYDRFTAWLKLNYGLLLSTLNPAVLRLQTLLSTLNSEYEGERLALFIVDSLGLSAWERVRARWQLDGVIGGAATRAAFAVLPTITILSRRAIFEGTPPSQFSSETHSQRLERALWAKRYHGQGACFHDAEMLGFSDSLARSVSHVCVVDVSWDKRGHSIDWRTDSIADAANVWAGRTPLRDMIRAALDAGYRVILTADHGQTECVGQGRLNVGTLPDERSKRVMLFNVKSLCSNASKDWTDNFRPAGLPPDMFPLFATGFNSFDLNRAASVSHGGLSLEEVLVPVAELFK